MLKFRLTVAKWNAPCKFSQKIGGNGWKGESKTCPLNIKLALLVWTDKGSGGKFMGYATAPIATVTAMIKNSMVDAWLSVEPFHSKIINAWFTEYDQSPESGD